MIIIIIIFFKSLPCTISYLHLMLWNVQKLLPVFTPTKHLPITLGCFFFLLLALSS